LTRAENLRYLLSPVKVYLVPASMFAHNLNHNPPKKITTKKDELVKSRKAPVIVIPVKTGIQENQSRRGIDGLGDFLGDHQARSFTKTQK